MKKKLESVLQDFLLHDVLGAGIIGFISAVIVLFLGGLANELLFPMVIVLVLGLLTLWYWLTRKALRLSTILVNGLVFLVVVMAFTVLMIVTKGNVDSPIFQTLSWIMFPYIILWGLLGLMGGNAFSFLTAVLIAFANLMIPMLFLKYLVKKKQILAFCGAAVILIGINLGFYVQRPQVKYGGHGFDYMNGYSSTDFKDYRVGSKNSKLATLDAPASLRIENEADMPIMDGAEACYPLYAAVAKEVYANIAEIEKGHEDDRDNGKIVQFTNTVVGFKRLILEDVDLFFGARPSGEQQFDAREMGVSLEVTPIGKEAFVFFVEADNPIDDISSDDLRAIYHGDITNWAQLGGKDQEIRAFQRPRNSGSQTMMEYFMGDVTLKEPQTYEVFNAMGGVIKKVAQYADEGGALGYSFRYFVEGLSQEKNVKLLKVDGVAPTLENIRNGSYPLTTSLCLITRKNDPNPYVQQMIDFMLSPQGQELVEKTGYAPLG